MSATRIIYGIFLFFMLVLAPWWAALAAVLLGMVRFRPYYEALAAGFVLDTIYGAVSNSLLGGRALIFSIFCGIAFMIIEAAFYVIRMR